MVFNRKDKGIAGMDMLIGVLTSVFLIAILVGVFTITNASFEEATWEETTDSLNETLTTVDNSTGEAVSTNTKRNCGSLTLTAVHNDTEAGDDIAAGNYSISGCTITAAAGSPYTDEDWHIIGTATYDADTTASLAANDTNTSIVGVTNWLPIIIIIAAVVVVLLLVSMIIAAIRDSRMAG